MHRPALIVLSALFALSLLPSGARAGGAPVPGVVAYRELVMSSMSKHMKMAGMVAKGEVARPADLVAHAKALHAAATGMVELFPEGTGPDKVKTEATAAIWSDAPRFAAAVAAYEAETAALVTLAEAGDLAGAGAQLQKVGATCGGCHETFKVD
jgi:cytochrome c556